VRTACSLDSNRLGGIFAGASQNGAVIPVDTGISVGPHSGPYRLLFLKQTKPARKSWGSFLDQAYAYTPFLDSLY